MAKMEAASIDVVISKTENGKKGDASSPASVLTRLNAGYFTICIAVGAQVLVLNALLDDQKRRQRSVNVILARILASSALFLLWLSLCSLILLSCLYLMRCVFHFWLVKAEYSHCVGANFLFVPWISWLLLLRAMPAGVLANFPHAVLLWVCVGPVVILDIKIYGQWFTTERRFLSLVANPTSHLPMMGNFVGAWAAAGMGWNETAICIFALGLAHYIVVFITLYQRLSGAARFQAALRPAFFLFCGTPSAACLAWSSISGGFGLPCKMLFFLSLFLLASLMCRPALFKKSMKRFSMAWWAYSFPLSFVAMAAAQYAEHVKGVAAAGLMLLLSALSILVFIGMLILTALNSDRLLLQNDPCLTFSSNLDIMY